MRCSEPWRVAAARLGRVVAAAFLALGAAAALAHKASDSYLQVDAGAAGLAVRWDIALRDLDAAIDLDADADGRLTWGEIRTAWPRIEAYALPKLRIDGCPLRPVGRALERRNDGAYAVLRLASDCTPAGMPAIAYGLFRDVDPTHRGIAKVERPGQPVVVSLLDPSQPAGATGTGQGGSAEGGAGAAAASAANAATGAGTGWGFLREGIRHILTGYDHVLFLLCLLLPSVMRRTPAGWQPVDRLPQAVLPVAGIVTAFTVAHSITLGLAATKRVTLAPAFIEPAIAATIVLAAFDNLRPVFPVRRAVVAFLFGLIHGFGFAGVLAELELPTAAFAWALLQFNVGLELGQLAIVAGATALLYGARRHPRYRGVVIGGGSVVAIAIGVIWFIERTAHVSLWPS